MCYHLIIPIAFTVVIIIITISSSSSSSSIRNNDLELENGLAGRN